MTKTAKNIIILLLLGNGVLASILIYNHVQERNRIDRIEAQISERALGIQNYLRMFAMDESSNDTTSYQLSSMIYSLSYTEEYSKHINSRRLFDAMMVSRDKVKENADELIEVFALIEADYKNPEIQRKMDNAIGKLF